MTSSEIQARKESLESAQLLSGIYSGSGSFDGSAKSHSTRGHMQAPPVSAPHQLSYSRALQSSLHSVNAPDTHDPRVLRNPRQHNVDLHNLSNAVSPGVSRTLNQHPSLGNSMYHRPLNLSPNSGRNHVQLSSTYHAPTLHAINSQSGQLVSSPSTSSLTLNQSPPLHKPAAGMAAIGSQIPHRNAMQGMMQQHGRWDPLGSAVETREMWTTGSGLQTRAVDKRSPTHGEEADKANKWARFQTQGGATEVPSSWWELGQPVGKDVIRTSIHPWTGLPMSFATDPEQEMARAQAYVAASEAINGWIVPGHGGLLQHAAYGPMAALGAPSFSQSTIELVLPCVQSDQLSPLAPWSIAFAPDQESREASGADGAQSFSHLPDRESHIGAQGPESAIAVGAGVEEMEDPTPLGAAIRNLVSGREEYRGWGGLSDVVDSVGIVDPEKDVSFGLEANDELRHPGTEDTSGGYDAKAEGMLDGSEHISVGKPRLDATDTAQPSTSDPDFPILSSPIRGSPSPKLWDHVPDGEHPHVSSPTLTSLSSARPPSSVGGGGSSSGQTAPAPSPAPQEPPKLSWAQMAMKPPTSTRRASQGAASPPHGGHGGHQAHAPMEVTRVRGRSISISEGTYNPPRTPSPSTTACSPPPGARPTLCPPHGRHVLVFTGVPGDVGHGDLKAILTPFGMFPHPIQHFVVERRKFYGGDVPPSARTILAHREDHLGFPLPIRQVFVEVPDRAAATKLVTSSPFRMRGQEVHVEESSQRELVAALFPKMAEWERRSKKRGKEREEEETYLFVGKEEIAALNWWCAHHKIFFPRNPSVPFEQVCSILHKVPWDHDNMTEMQRNALYELAKISIACLSDKLREKKKGQEVTGDVNEVLMIRVLKAGMYVPAFTDRQRWNIMKCSHLTPDRVPPELKKYLSEPPRPTRGDSISTVGSFLTTTSEKSSTRKMSLATAATTCLDDDTMEATSHSASASRRSSHADAKGPLANGSEETRWILLKEEAV
ncbi:hypothetical protein M427DRAFT_51232 [Gonapodya prolifera JEL478]|uniref:RRM domain-containing protein n=1 Tax=Gonapodya prolifera (strain JEL478) TaxID=1344416 RepID=A0A139AYM9_GONPJ|nr:hypothetical protein M427DRAFT_51232 [Gonapodya prolifera JEL478]|eukprot:KXS21862.1 hypothetical protein M427DRAFT_51232 [Gonapodya prolifera JEL478]